MGYHKSRSQAIKAVSKKMARNAKTNKHQKQSFVVKEGKVLVTFESNLQTWMNMNGLSNERLSSRAGISLDRVKKLSTGKTIPTQDDVERLASAFRVNVNTFVKGCDYTMPAPKSGINKIEIPLDVQDAIKKSTQDEAPISEKTSPAADSLSVKTDALNKYVSVPKPYQREIVSLFYSWLLNKTKLSQSQLENATGIGKGMVSHYKKKASCPSYDYIIEQAAKLEAGNFLPQNEFFGKLLDLLDDYIPNYNLRIAYRKYGFSLSKFSTVLGLTASRAGNWKNYIDNIPRVHEEKISDVFGLEPGVFFDTFMSEDDFPLDMLKDSRLGFCQQSLSLVDKPTNFQKHNERKVSETGKIIKAEKTKDDVRENTPVKADPKNADTIYEEITPISDRTMKMYNKLSPEHKETVDKLIEKYFWEDLI